MTTDTAAPLVLPTDDRSADTVVDPGSRPAWERPALATLLVATGVLYLWGLGRSGWGNSFYSAAVQAGSQSWKAFFYGSSDAANSITVDKTPASMWVMSLSARVFGVNAWSILAPQALEGVATVAVLYATVRRWFSPAAALLAGVVCALTPVAVLMFRFNNPDALLTLLLTAAAYATVRALERASTRWLAFAAALVGLGFMTKMLQALLVVPALGLVYLLAAPTPLRRRLGQLLVAGAALVVSAGWWVAIVELVPASSRPYIGGSQNNSILELVLGYNGFGRLTGNETGSVGGGFGGGGSMWGSTGATRLFGSDIGGQVAWLLPAALLLLVGGLAITARAPRLDRTRAALLLWGGWLLVTGLIFSFMQGIFHAYYTVALAPAIGAIVGIGLTYLWAHRRHPAASVALALTVGGTAIWSSVLLHRSPTWQPWLATAVLVTGLLAAVAIVVVTWLPGRLAIPVAIAGLAAMLAGPSAYAVQTAGTPHTGAIPTAGPAVVGGRGGFAGRFPGGAPNGAAGAVPPPGGFGQGGPGQGTVGPGGRPVGAGGGPGGFLDSTPPGAALTALLKADSGHTWTAAAIGSNSASGYQLAAGKPVMAVGGFNGSDPSPTLAQFKSYVAQGRIHYFIGGGIGLRANSGSSDSGAISTWVTATFTPTTVDGVTLYDLTARATGTGAASPTT